MKGWIWHNFLPEEVLSPDGLAQLRVGILLVHPQLMNALQDFRKFINSPLLINHGGHQYRGYRSPRENYDIVKGEKFSFHMQGLAADITVLGVPIEQLRDKALEFGWHGVGYYPTRNFIHCDMRPRLDTSHIFQWTE